MNDRSEELKPCPFCGGEAIRDTIYIVCCRKCFAQADVNLWNRRAKLVASQSDNEE